MLINRPSIPHLRWLCDPPELREPILIAAFEGWNDAGDAASIAARYLAGRFDAERVAEIDPEDFYDFSTVRPMVRLDSAHRRTLTWPTTDVLAARVPQSNRDVIVVLGIEPQLRWRAFCATLIRLASTLQVSRALTFGALLSNVPHTRPVDIYGATEDETLMRGLNLSRSSYEGPTGIVGVLSSEFQRCGFGGVSFWAAVPSYVPGTPSPKAGLALVHRAGEVLGVTVPVTDLEVAAVSYERQVTDLVSEDAETVAYMTSLEEAWDAENANGPDSELADDPKLLVAEVENFLRHKD